MPDDFVTILKRFGPVVLVSAAVGAGIYALVKDAQGDEERPPIIVSNGSVDITSAYADDTNQNKGVWAADTGAGVRTWSQSHQNTGPQNTRNVILNASVCTGPAVLLRSGGLRITFTNGTTSWWVELAANGNHMQLDPKDQLVTITRDGADASHVQVKPTDALAGATRISMVESVKGKASCTFDPGSQPIIWIEQKK